MVAVVLTNLYMGDNCSSCRSAIARCMLCGEGGCGDDDDGGGGGGSGGGRGDGQ